MRMRFMLFKHDRTFNSKQTHTYAENKFNLHETVSFFPPCHSFLCPVRFCLVSFCPTQAKRGTWRKQCDKLKTSQTSYEMENAKHQIKWQNPKHYH